MRAGVYIYISKEANGSEEIMNETGNSDDEVRTVTTPTQAKYLLHSLEQVARGIGLYKNSDNIAEFMYFNQTGTISSLNSKPLKLVDQLTYFGSNISSTNSDDSIHIGKVCTGINMLTTIWKSNLSNKTKR